MCDRATAAQRNTNGDRMSHNRATGIMADELTKLPNDRHRGARRTVWSGHSLGLVRRYEVHFL